MMWRADGRFPGDGETFLATEAAEIPDGDTADIRGIVPFVRQFPGDRCPAAKKQLAANAIEREVGEADHAALADPQHFPDETGRVIDLLERLGQDDVIEVPVGVILDFLVDVTMQDGEALFDAPSDLSLVVFDAGAAHLFGGRKVAQKPAGTATEIENGGSGFDPGGDNRQIIAHRRPPWRHRRRPGPENGRSGPRHWHWAAGKHRGPIWPRFPRSSHPGRFFSWPGPWPETGRWDKASPT